MGECNANKMRKRKERRPKQFLLLDKSVLCLLTPDERKELDSKHTIIYPSILLAESAQHGLDQQRYLLEFKNTVPVVYWVQRAKMDLLIGARSNCYKIGAKIPIRSIYEESCDEREEMVRQSIRIVDGMEKDDEMLKNSLPVFRGEEKRMEFAKSHKDIPDEKLVKEFNQVFGGGTHSHRQSPRLSICPIPKGIGNKKIPEIRKFLDRYKEVFALDSLEKVYECTARTFDECPENILQFLCKSEIIPLNADEQTIIFNRFTSEGKPPIGTFAPYALLTARLYLTIFLYLTENQKNSSPQGGLKDFEYLYYALDDNVTFLSSDGWHKRCIEEIPLLKNVRKRFKFVDQNNREGLKKVLRSIGIKYERDK